MRKYISFKYDNILASKELHAGNKVEKMLIYTRNKKQI